MRRRLVACFRADFCGSVALFSDKHCRSAARFLSHGAGRFPAWGERWRPSKIPAVGTRCRIETPRRREHRRGRNTSSIRARITRAKLRAELAHRLPFETTIAICDGREISKLVASEPYASERARPDVVRFISVLTGLPRSNPDLPIAFPGRGTLLVRILARDGCFIVGQYRRHMKTIGHLGGIDRVFGVPVTTRNWGTIASIGRVLTAGQPADSRTTTQSRTRPIGSVPPWPVRDKHCRSGTPAVRRVYEGARMRPNCPAEA